MADSDLSGALDILRRIDQRGRETRTPQPDLSTPNLLKQWLASMVNAGQFPEAGPWGGATRAVDRAKSIRDKQLQALEKEGY